MPRRLLSQPAIYDPLCGLRRNLTSCSADDGSYTTGKLLMTGAGNLGYGTKYTALGQWITRAQCCAACQADHRCDAFNFINSGGGMGCYFLTK